MNVQEFSDKIRCAGVVGGGGAGFPTYFKYNGSCDYIILNGAECEPLLQVDQQMLAKYAQEIVDAVAVAVNVTNAQKAYIALKSKYKAAVKALKPLCKGKVELFTLDNFYPAGDEQILVNEITGRVVPEGGIPIQVGVIVNNAVTFYNMYQALHGIPVTQREVTVGGAVKNPVTLSVPVGTPVSKCIECAGGTTINNYTIINGGPMMGAIVSENSFVTKTTSGILVFPEDHTVIKQKNDDISREMWMSRTMCCQCMLCTEVCPRYLIGHRMEPHKIMRMISYGNIEDHAEKLQGAFLCCECNACTAFGCPMGLSPKNVNRIVKQKLLSLGIKNTLNNKPENARSVREYRKIPVSRLVKRLNISEYMNDAPLSCDQELGIQYVEIALNAHIGRSSAPLVAVGDSVSKGQLIADTGADALGSCYHASIDGIVTDVSSDGIRIEKK